MRGKCQRIFFNAWNSGQMESNSGTTAVEWQRKDGEKGDFSRIEGGFPMR